MKTLGFIMPRKWVEICVASYDPLRSVHAAFSHTAPCNIEFYQALITWPIPIILVVNYLVAPCIAIIFLLIRTILHVSLSYIVFIDTISSVLWIHLTTYTSFDKLVFYTCFLILFSLSLFNLVLMPFIERGEDIGSHWSSYNHCIS